ncbi:glycosyl transferase family 2 [Aurantimonas sp. VKM B-3413]|uniref:glycosyl transferase family 2 n=1 Tax=Aurantimonas sp. VKM B-3413 TaxID=2779401 RepID=UPI001E3A7CE3|nr:glycosyl transferase family 2 [Aurantimonas sp. VKM B-3413]MCB8838759.1 glycosyl transferase family 2 [Aurantimonas sp. VKM B-3413]
MLSVLMDCGPDDQRLAESLATLVPGAVEGVVREVVLFDRGMGPGARKVAEHAGCRIEPAEAFHAVVREAKGEWLLLLEPGARLQPGWIAAVIEHVEAVGEDRGVVPAARFARARADRRSVFQRLRQIRTALAEGLLLRKPQAIGLSRRGTNLEELAKGIAVGRLAADIRPVRRR